MKTENIERYLESFGKQVVNRAKGGLQRAGKGGKLEKSIKFEVVRQLKALIVTKIEKVIHSHLVKL